MTTVQAALRSGTMMLTDANISNAAGDARHLMAAALGVGKDRISLHLQDQLGEIAEAGFFAMVLGRKNGQPVSHLVGGRDFYGRWFIVTNDVLDPRPETEFLLQEALSAPFKEVLDLGTGSGAILVTLLAERETAVGIGTDISQAALHIADRNAQAHAVASRAQFELSDWYAGVGGTFDLIVSNPPYIARSEMEGLQPEVRLFEPRMALTDEADGLSAYRIICGGAPAHLTPGGRLIVEIGPTQADAVAAMMADAGMIDVQVRQDFDGRDRVVAAKMPISG